MKRIAILAAAVLGALLAPAPATADEATTAHGFAETTICVVRTDAAKGWRIGAAIRAWNAAQDYVHLSNVAVPSCAVVEIREYDDPASDWNGYTAWPRWSESVWSEERQRLMYHHAEVWLNRAKLAESVKPIWRGTHQGCWRKSVVAHEIGHTLGLEHTTGAESVMSGERDFETYCGAPSAGDVTALAALYG